MIAHNVVGSMTPSLLALIQKIREEFQVHAEIQGDDSDVVKSGLKILDQANEELLALRREEELIQMDVDLSDEGRRKAMTKVVGRSVAALSFVQKHAVTKRAAFDEAQRQLSALPKSSDDPIVEYLRSMEIRQQLRTLAIAERMRVFLAAVEQNNANIVRAVNTAPAGEVLIPKDFLARVEQERVEQTQPKEWRRLQTLDFVAEKLQILAGSIEGILGSYGNVPVFKAPVVGKTDLGLQNTQAAPPKSAADAPPAGGLTFQ